ncbi:MAG: hypothetical protein NZ837_06250 [Gammaproteobacteria bacterium]|nr:hypothetical protein [Gammaproteobacteria bacterium]
MRVINLVFLMVTLIGYSSSTHAAKSHSDCWSEFYEGPDYGGSVVRIEGPAKLSNLRRVQGDNWESRIDSMVVGPNAQARLFEKRRFTPPLAELSRYPGLAKSLGITDQQIQEGGELVFNANEKVHHLAEFDFHKKAKSMIIECIN